LSGGFRVDALEGTGRACDSGFRVRTAPKDDRVFLERGLTRVQLSQKTAIFAKARCSKGHPRALMRMRDQDRSRWRMRMGARGSICEGLHRTRRRFSIRGRGGFFQHWDRMFRRQP